MSTQAIRSRAKWMSARLSYRTASRRKRLIQASVRSTTQRWRPSRALFSIPFRAIRQAIPRLLKYIRHRTVSYALSACTFQGVLRGRPARLRLTGGIASRSGSNARLSWTLAALSRTASGMPFRSTMRCRLLPGRPRSVGFGPVCSPPLFAGIVALSRHARLQSIRSESWRRLRSSP